MLLQTILHNFADYLMQFMAGVLFLCLLFRWLAFRSSQKDDVYFSTFTKEIDKCLDEDEEQKLIVDNVDDYIQHLLNRVVSKLPQRNIRFHRENKRSYEEKNMGAKNTASFKEYSGGQHALAHAIRAESSAFKSDHPPNYRDLTTRIMDQDDNWVKLFGLIPIEGITRIIDVLPSLFIIFGIFGTFIGITTALPEIAKIDFNNFEGAGIILSNFVKHVTFAMSASIAGILCSLIMTFLNTLFPLRGLRNSTFKKVSNCFEAIWFSIHGSKAFENEMSYYFERIARSVKKIEDLLAKKEETRTRREEIREEIMENPNVLGLDKFKRGA